MPGNQPKNVANIHGGKCKTSFGTLKILCVFIRFSDDNEVTGNWPNPVLLPGWASTLVDPYIPANHIYSNLNLTNFFDRCSGGDGAGYSGLFQMIGDVAYVTVDHPRSWYLNYTQVNTEVFSKLDDPSLFNINFAQYDNWTFMKYGQYFNHQNVPDGILDQVFVFYRQPHTSGYGGYLGIDIDGSGYLTNDGVRIKPESGTTHFNAKNFVPPLLVFNPAHEFCHYLFGGDQVNGHFDGRDWYSSTYYGGHTNYGRVQSFTLMCTGGNMHMSAFERYRLGWLNPTVIETNTSFINLQDTHVKNNAVLIPLSLI